MGIRFQCPACGAKLNVKAELAGKRGACPKCQAKIQIPNAAPDTEAAPTVALTAAPAPAPAPPAPVLAPTPPAEAKWFVRPPSGGQYGPALESVLRTWVGEGRITPDTMIRRDGDGDWQTAVSVFPELGGAAAAIVKVPTAPVVTAPVNVGPVVDSSAPLDASSAAAAMLLARRKRARKMGMLVMAILIVAVLILLPILIYVLMNPAAPPTEEPTTALHLRIPYGEEPCYAATYLAS